MNAVLNLFNTNGFISRGDCGDWSPALLLVYNANDIGTFLAYLIISIVFVRKIRTRHEQMYNFLFWFFGAFIVSCGVGHLGAATMTWWPGFRALAVVDTCRTVLSLVTAAVLCLMAPGVAETPSMQAIAQRQRQLALELESYTRLNEADQRWVRDKLDEALHMLQEAKRVHEC